MLVLPVLIALGAVAGVQDRVAAGVIEASFVTANLPLLGEHPILKKEGLSFFQSYQNDLN